MAEIDWSEAPEGYPIWIQDLTPNKAFDGSGWHCDDGDRYTDQDGGYWTKPVGNYCTVHERLDPQWSGTGLPPVGIDIEVMHGTYGWIGARVVGYDGEATIVRTNDGYAGVFPHEYRAIRTEAQIAAEEREKAILNACAVIKQAHYQLPSTEVAPVEKAKAYAAALYDAGYRKQEPKP